VKKDNKKKIILKKDNVKKDNVKKVNAKKSNIKKVKKTKNDGIPIQLAKSLVETTNKLAKEYCKFLTVDIKNVFVYINEGEWPLCRLKFLGKVDEWEFAIFKYSSMTFSTNEIFFPRKGNMHDLIDTALSAYSHR